MLVLYDELDCIVMNPNIAIIVDDLAADRRLAARALERAGWTAHTARSSVEGDRLVAQLLCDGDAARIVIITDLHMPNDPPFSASDRRTVAGAQFALRLRARMERGELPRAPIIALTALTEREIHLTALAFGCDAVLPKPATPDLVARIEQALAQARTEDGDPVGAGALLRLLRCRLAESTIRQVVPDLTEQDITKALLAYHRRGLVGLGESTLAAHLALRVAGLLQRGEQTYAMLVRHLDEIMQLGAPESLAILQGELVNHASPAEQCAELGLSLSEYYRRRREATLVLLDLLTR
jgi:CheY-like chemotaxis protein